MAACHWLSLFTCLLVSLHTAAEHTTELFGTVKVESKYMPKERHYPSMVLYKKRLWTFGGLFLENRSQVNVLGDLNCFDIDSKTWIEVAADGTPAARVGHDAVVDFAGTMWLWGGQLEDMKTFDIAIYSLNLITIDLFPKDGKKSGAWQKVKVKGTSPAARGGHSAVMNGTGMVIFGGHGHDKDKAITFADVQYLDFEKKMWSEIKCQGDVPSGRHVHGAAMTSLGEMWVYGGQDKDSNSLEDLYYLKLNTKTWVKVAAKGVSPGPLQSHVQVMDAAGRMWLAGGFALKSDGPWKIPKVSRNDKVFYIDTPMSANAEWKEVEEFRGAVDRDGAKAAMETNGRMWCYGGIVAEPMAIVWLDTNQPTPSTATTSAHPLDPAAQSGGVGVGTILVILLVVVAIAAGALFLLRRRREMRLLQEVQEPRQIELGPRA